LRPTWAEPEWAAEPFAGVMALALSSVSYRHFWDTSGERVP
jgi:hypothetical protein